MFPLYDEAVIGRKDVLFFAAFALYAWWMPRPASRWASAAAFGLGAAVTLAHEMFFFFTPYLFAMRLLEPGRSARLPDDPRSVRLQADLHRFTPELSLFGGALIALLLVVTVGADLRGDAQCASLLARGFDKDLCTGIMQYPVTTIRASLQETADIVRAQHYLRDYSIAAVLAAVPLVPFFASIRQRIPRAAVLSLLAALAFTLPLFVLVIDWGRLLNIHDGDLDFDRGVSAGGANGTGAGARGQAGVADPDPAVNRCLPDRVEHSPLLRCAASRRLLG